MKLRIESEELADKKKSFFQFIAMAAILVYKVNSIIKWLVLIDVYCP